ncbi:hypothetical protein LB507_001221 [Fusarium sp. FIESC RH6]|nr:hypothetical protein LB507_001221 [Fusarium sp. FIESC RH6]
MSTVILTSAPLLLSQVPLASFVPDISQPYADVKKLYTVSPSEYSTREDVNFTGAVNASSERFFEIMTTRFANLLVRHEQDITYRVEAKNGKVYTLDSPHDLFISILGDEESGTKAKLWLEQCRRQGLSPRFVVGFRTFIDAKLSRGESMLSEVRGGVDIPISTIHGDVTGMGDAKIGGGYKADRGIKSEAELPDERIYAIAYRKIRVTRKKGESVATLDLKTKWEPFSKSRSEGDSEEYFEAGIAGIDDDEECEEVCIVRSEASGDGEAVRIAVLNEDDSDDDE